MKLPVNVPYLGSPWRQIALFVVSTIVLSWLFWFPAAFMGGERGSIGGSFLFALGSLAPLAVVIFLEIWQQGRLPDPRTYVKRPTWRAVVVALILPACILAPAFLLRVFGNAIDLGRFIEDSLGALVGILGYLVIGFGEETGWRGYVLPRLKSLNLVVVNVLMAALVFVW